MKSSSQLFPVTLRSAELFEGVCEDVYELFPGVAEDPGVRIAVTRLRHADQQPTRPPVVLVHGAFANRRFWCGGAAFGFAGRLIQQGHEVWIPEMRGHGRSPMHPGWSRNSLSAIALQDWPAVSAFIHEQTHRRAHWVGYGAGALSLALALIESPLFRLSALSACFVDTHIEPRRWMAQGPRTARVRRWWKQRNGVYDGVADGLGAEPEAPGVLRELQRWMLQERGESHPIRSRLAAVDIPACVLSFGDQPESRARDQRFTGLLGGQIRQHRRTNVPAADAYPVVDGVTEWRLSSRAWSGILEWLGQVQPARSTAVVASS